MFIKNRCILNLRMDTFWGSVASKRLTTPEDDDDDDGFVI